VLETNSLRRHFNRSENIFSGSKIIFCLNLIYYVEAFINVEIFTQGRKRYFRFKFISYFEVFVVEKVLV